MMNAFCSVCLLVGFASAFGSAGAADELTTPSHCSRILPGGCYTKPLPTSPVIKPLTQAVPMKTGLWRDELLDKNGKPQKDASIESCRIASDWRDHSLATGSEASEGCSRTRLISRQMGNPPALQVGISETCREDGKTLVTTAWLVRKDNGVDAPLHQYEMHTSTQTMATALPRKTTKLATNTSEIERTRHTWISECLTTRK
jgi:hypothetical protein